MSTVEPENADRKQDTRFKPGQSGNPAGKPKGTHHKATLAMEALLDGEAEALTRKAVEMALAGDTTALRLCMDRIAPPRRDRPISFTLPKLETAADAVKAASAILEAVAGGDITPGEAAELGKLVEAFARTLEVSELEDRISRLEERTRQRSAPSSRGLSG
jgi:hypothetical protein